VHLREDRVGLRALALVRPDRRQPRQPAAGSVLRRAERVEQLRVGQLAGGGEVPERGRRLAGDRREPQRGGVERDGPAILGGQALLEGGHGGADDTDVHPTVEVERRLIPECGPVREIGWSGVESRRHRSVASAQVAMTAGTGGPVHLGAASEVGRPRGHLVQDHSVVLGEAGRQRANAGVERVGGRESLHQCEKAVEGGDGRAAGPGRKLAGGAPCLFQEEPGLIHLRRGHDSAVHHPDAVFLGRERGSGRHPSHHRRVVHLGGGPSGGAEDECGDEDRQRRADEIHFHPVFRGPGLN
jgi:hypothetical protein